MITERKIIIAGPCAAESREQVVDSAGMLIERGVFFERASWWKPRTQPGFEGIGTTAAPWAAEATRMGIIIGTEVLIPQHVTDVVKGIDENGGDPSLVFLWIGSRNQNHLIQRGIAQRTLDETPKGVKLLIKNQPWCDEKHWLGIVDHVMSTGIDPIRVSLVHRGFSPNGCTNPDNLRNPPDFEMAMRVREKTGLSMLLDPSHIGGSVENVFRITQLASSYDFDGLMVEVHPNPTLARTDARQQLNLQEFDEILKLIRN